MKKLVLALSLAIILSFYFSTVMAQDNAKKAFALMDADQDGKVSKEEFMNFYMEYAKKNQDPRFNQLDTNGDGNISRDEFMAVKVKEAQNIGAVKFKRIDANKDGVISEEELSKRFRQYKNALEELKKE